MSSQALAEQLWLTKKVKVTGKEVASALTHLGYTNEEIHARVEGRKNPVKRRYLRGLEPNGESS